MKIQTTTTTHHQPNILRKDLNVWNSKTVRSLKFSLSISLFLAVAYTLVVIIVSVDGVSAL